MGKPTASASSAAAAAPPAYKPYRDDPSFDDAVSLHTSPEHNEDLLHLPSSSLEDTLALPPAYSDSPGARYQDDVAVLPHNEHTSMVLDDCIKLSDGTCVLIDYEPFPEQLERQIEQWAKSPPALMVTIRGYHKETTQKNDGKNQTTDVTDFDIKLRLTEYLFTHPGKSVWARTDVAENDDKRYRGTVFRKKSKLAKDPEALKPSLLEWCHRFCASHHQLKSFRYRRTVSGLPTIELNNYILDLVRSTNYRGHIIIDFPIENPGVEIYNNHWINRWRHNGWIKFFFIITFLWIFSWPYLFFRTKKYDIVQTIWPFSKDIENGGRQYATLSEGQWFNRWSKCIERNVIAKKQGLLTEEDLLIEPAGLPENIDTGNATANAALGLLRGGLTAYQTANRQLGWGHDT